MFNARVETVDTSGAFRASFNSLASYRRSLTLRAEGSGTTSKPIDWYGADDDFLLLERYLQFLPVTLPPIAIELIDHDFDNDYPILLSCRALFPESFSGCARVKRDAAEFLCKQLANVEVSRFFVADDWQQDFDQNSHWGASADGAEQEPGHHRQGNRFQWLGIDLGTSVVEDVLAPCPQHPDRGRSDFGDAFAQPVHLGSESL